MLFEIRPAGRGAPRIDPKPILDGWKLLESTRSTAPRARTRSSGRTPTGATIGQILLMSKDTLIQRVLANPRIELYSCGRRDIEAGVVDRRVLATLEFLASSGLKPTVTSLRCGHGLYTAGGNVSAHSSGNAVDIAKINGIPIMGNQGAGSITDITVRRLLTLQGTMKPAQIITLMNYEGADNTLAMGDHADHIHVGFRPQFDPEQRAAGSPSPSSSRRSGSSSIDRLGQIDNPTIQLEAVEVRDQGVAARARQPRAQGRVAHVTRDVPETAVTSESRRFRFVQFEFPWALGPEPGRYTIREQLGEPPAHVLVLAELGRAASGAGCCRARPARGRGRRAPRPSPSPSRS